MVTEARIYPASHYVTPAAQLEQALTGISDELRERLGFFRSRGRLLEAQRLEQRTLFDMEMLREIGYCHGVENYSRHLSGRKPGQNPATLMDYLPKDALVIIDESHVTVPQIRGMYAGDRSRKETLVEYGFRLPSAFDNRPLTFDEFAVLVRQALYVSATPGPYELELAGGQRSRHRASRGKAGRWPSRSSAPPGSWIPGSPCGPPARRWTTSWRRCARGPSATSAC